MTSLLNEQNVTVDKDKQTDDTGTYVRNTIHGVSYIGEPKPYTAMYVTNKVSHLLQTLEQVDGCLVFAENGMTVNEILLKSHRFVFTSNPQLDYILFTEQLEKEEIERNRNIKYLLKEPGYYCSETAEIGEGTYIEPGCMIGHGVTIGKNAKLLSGCVIKNAVIGDNFICGENCSIGAYGFTMAEDGNGNKIRMPSLGKVIIGNDVEVGVLTNVSRGSAGDTILEDHVKIDALVHIAHDVHLHKNVEVTAAGIIGGFDEIMDGAYIGINAVIRNRRTIGKRAIVGMGAVVIRDVEDGCVVAGNPVRVLRKTGDENKSNA